MLHSNSIVSATDIIVLVAEILSKDQSTFNKISYRDVINFVRICANTIAPKMTIRVSGVFKRTNLNKQPSRQPNWTKLKYATELLKLSKKIPKPHVFLKEKRFSYCVPE